MASLLSAAQRRRPPRAQIATLARIGRRALCKADWLTEQAREYPDSQFADAWRADVPRYAAKAAAAVAEIERLAAERGILA